MGLRDGLAPLSMLAGKSTPGMPRAAKAGDAGVQVAGDTVTVAAGLDDHAGSARPVPERRQLARVRQLPIGCRPPMRTDGSGWAAMVIVATGSGFVLWVWSWSGLKEGKDGEHAAAVVW